MSNMTTNLRPSVAVAIVTWNRRQSLCAVVKEVVGNPTPPCELLIVDQGEEYDYSKITNIALERGIPCRYVFSPYVSIPGARNVAIGMTKADVLLYLDDDVELLSDIVEAHADCYTANPFISGVVGHVVVSHGSERFVLANTTRPKGRYVRCGRGCHMSFRVSVLIEMGGFNAFMGRCGEESELFQRLESRDILIANGSGAIVKHLVHPGGNRTEEYQSFSWWETYLRDNVVRIVRVHGPIFGLLWPVRHITTLAKIVRSSPSIFAAAQMFLREFRRGFRLGVVARNTPDHISLSMRLLSNRLGLKTSIDMLTPDGVRFLREFRNEQHFPKLSVSPPGPVQNNRA